MRNYTFLLKPIFFIFSLLFATWLVIVIEKISPSDFGQKSVTVQKTTSPENMSGHIQYLQYLCTAYKAGIIDSTVLNQKLTLFLELEKKGACR